MSLRHMCWYHQRPYTQKHIGHGESDGSMQESMRPKQISQYLRALYASTINIRTLKRSRLTEIALVTRGFPDFISESLHVAHPSIISFRTPKSMHTTEKAVFVAGRNQKNFEEKTKNCHLQYAFHTGISISHGVCLFMAVGKRKAATCNARLKKRT